MLLHVLRAAVALTAEPVRGHEDGEAEVALVARQQSHTEAESSKAEAHSGAKACSELVPRAVCWTCRAEPHNIRPSGWQVTHILLRPAVGRQPCKEYGKAWMTR